MHAEPPRTAGRPILSWRRSTLPGLLLGLLLMGAGPLVANTPPTITAIADQTTNEDTPTPAIAFTIGDLETPVESLTLVATTDNPLLLSIPSIAFGGAGASRTVRITPLANRFGSARVRVRVNDTDGGTNSVLFTVTVNPVNDAPTITAIADQTFNEDGSVTLPFTLGDPETPAASLTLVATTDNPTLLPPASIVFGGSGASRTVKLAPPANRFGIAKVRVRVNDPDGGTNSVLFNVTVKSVNDAPTITTIADQTLDMSSSSVIPFTIGDIETAATSLALVVTTDNPTLLPASGLVLGGAGTSRTLKLTPAANRLGTGKVRVRVNDSDGGTSSTLFTVAVGPRPNANLLTPTSVHPGDTWMKASVPVQDGMTYLWTVLPGTATATLISGLGTPVVGFAAGSEVGTFQLQVEVRNSVGTSVTATRIISVERGTWLIKNGTLPHGWRDSTATALPDGRILIIGGGLGAHLYDPATGNSTPTGSLGTPRSLHTATLLANGKVVVIGGEVSYPDFVANIELYDPALGTWSPAGRLGSGREKHTATLLPNGKVLVVGGLIDAISPTATCGIYDPATGSFARTGDLGMPRMDHTATLLPSGKVLVAGGFNAESLATPMTELFDPATGTWSPTGSLGTGRYRHTATLLATGKVLVAGGYVRGATASSELYDPASGLWAPTQGLATARLKHSATLLASGKVLVAGGDGIYGCEGFLTSAELYDPALGTWTVTGKLAFSRDTHTATLLPGGRVLVEGGGVSTEEVYDPESAAWSARGTSLNRLSCIAVKLADGQVLVAGGAHYLLSGCYPSTLTTAEVFNPATGIWTPKSSMLAGRMAAAATLIPGGQVLVAGGGYYDSLSSTHALASAELFNPQTGAWAATGSLTSPRMSHTATLLANGKVLVVGGQDFNGFAHQAQTLATAELYDPTSGIWTPAGGMGTVRIEHSATLLPDGKVLVVGGQVSYAVETSMAELFDPATGLWTPTGSLHIPRRGHTATLLSNGKVLVAGGTNSGWSSGLSLTYAELYDPATGTWTTVGNMAVARYQAASVLLPDGRVLIMGGTYGDLLYSSAEIFDPALDTWTTTGSMQVACQALVAFVLNDGTVLAAFGGAEESLTEIYRP